MKRWLAVIAALLLFGALSAAVTWYVFRGLLWLGDLLRTAL